MPWSRRRGPILARLLVSAVLVTVLFFFLPGKEILSAIIRVPLRLLIAVVGGFLAGHVVAAFKWRLLLSACGLTAPPAHALRAHGAGLFANLCLPSLVGGDLLRALLVSRPSRRIEVAAVGTLADRVIDTVALVMLVSVAAFFLPGSLTDTTARILLMVVTALLLGGTLCLVAVLLKPGWLPLRLRARVQGAHGAVLALIQRPLLALSALCLALATQTAFVLLNMTLGRAVGLSLPLAAWLFLWPLAKLAALAPISLGGIGVREVAFAALVTPFGVDPALAVAQSLVWEAVLITGGLAGGLFWAIGGPRLSLRENAADRLSQPGP